MAEALLRFRLGQNGTAETLYVAGELDVASAPALEHAVARALDGQGGAFRLDVRELTFMDSTGARSLLHVHNWVEDLGRQLVVVAPTPAVRRVLELMGLDQIMDIEDGAPAPRRSV